MSDSLHQDVHGVPARVAAERTAPAAVNTWLSPPVSRRSAFARFGIVTLAGAGVAGCAVDDGGDQGPTEVEGEIASVDEVPVGGGIVDNDAEVVLTQPADGEFRGFTAICTHQGCTVSDVADGTINCACHGSRFSIEDASVVNGPATEPLTEYELTVQAGSISLVSGATG